jgi:hypothetical protein
MSLRRLWGLIRATMGDLFSSRRSKGVFTGIFFSWKPAGTSAKGLFKKEGRLVGL